VADPVYRAKPVLSKTAVTESKVLVRPPRIASFLSLKKYPNNVTAIENTYEVLTKGDFKSPAELKPLFPWLDNFK
jgi:hypothetical protein